MIPFERYPGSSQVEEARDAAAVAARTSLALGSLVAAIGIFTLANSKSPVIWTGGLLWGGWMLAKGCYFGFHVVRLGRVDRRLAIQYALAVQSEERKLRRMEKRLGALQEKAKIAVVKLVAMSVTARGVVDKERLDIYCVAAESILGAETPYEEYFNLLKEVEENRTHIKETYRLLCQDIRLAYSENFLQVVFEFCVIVIFATGFPTKREKEFVKRVGIALGLSQSTMVSVYERFRSQAARIEEESRKSVGAMYRALGLREGASQSEIKKAYRRIAMKHHPDRTQHLSDTEKQKAQIAFMEATHAYQALVVR